MIRNLVLLSLAMLVGVLLSEGILRATGMVAIDGVFTVDADDFERIPGIFAPDRSVEVRGVLPHTVTINALGYRGPPLARDKPEGETRLFATGDSFLFGDLVSDSATLPQQLERELAGRCERVRVINGGVGGTTITAQTEMVKRALEIGPEAVLLQFNENDLRDLAATPSWEVLEANRAAKSAFPLSIAYPLLRETALWNLSLQLRARARDRRIDAAPDPPADVAKTAGRCDSGADAAGEPSAERRLEYEARLLDLHRMLAARSIPLYASVFPNHDTVYGRGGTADVDWFLEMAERLEIPAVSMLPALRSSGLGESVLYLLPDDGHPGPEGYRVAASALADFLVERQAFRAACGG
jgi:lysophospholipase L1-like esterase